MSIPDNCNPIEILKGKLVFFAADESFKPSASSPSHVFFKTDTTLVYTGFFADFGPLDIGLTSAFCQQLSGLLADAQTSNKIVAYYCSKNGHCRANSVVLLCAYMIFALGYTAERAYGHFLGIRPPLSCFRDAAFCINSFPITALDCARAMRRAVTFGQFDLDTFSAERFQRMNKLEHGDCSWIIPGKFIAFSGPVEKRRQLSAGLHTLTPIEYVPVLKALGVTCIVRFNSKCYDRSVFTRNGIRHVELFYEDGGNPSESILQRFLHVCENEKGAIAVHCKAGLGRTGTNIAAYMMKHYGYSAREATAWCRLCRPGCVVGPQQHYLCSIEDRMKREGEEYRKMNNIRKPFPKQYVPAARQVQYTSQAPQLPGRISVVANDGPKTEPPTDNLKYDKSTRNLPLPGSPIPAKNGTDRCASPTGVTEMISPVKDLEKDRTRGVFSRESTTTQPPHANQAENSKSAFRSIFDHEHLSSNQLTEAATVQFQRRPTTSVGVKGERRMQGMATATTSTLAAPSPQHPAGPALKDRQAKGVGVSVSRKMAFSEPPSDSFGSGSDGIGQRVRSSSRSREASSAVDTSSPCHPYEASHAGIGSRPKTADGHNRGTSTSTGTRVRTEGIGLSSSAFGTLQGVTFTNSRNSHSPVAKGNHESIRGCSGSYPKKGASALDAMRPATSNAVHVGVHSAFVAEAGNIKLTKREQNQSRLWPFRSQRPTSSSAALRRRNAYS